MCVLGLCVHALLRPYTVAVFRLRCTIHALQKPSTVAVHLTKLMCIIGLILNDPLSLGFLAKRSEVYGSLKLYTLFFTRTAVYTQTDTHAAKNGFVCADVMSAGHFFERGGGKFGKRHGH